MGGFVNGRVLSKFSKISNVFKNQVFDVFGKFWARIRIPHAFLYNLDYFSARKVPWGRVLGQNKIWDFLGWYPPI